MRAGVAWGSPICPSASAAATPNSAHLPLILILERLDEGGDGLGVTDLSQRLTPPPRAPTTPHPGAPG
jgi:hypothetical protein